MTYDESLYEDGYQPLVCILIKVEGDTFMRRIVVAPEFLECLPMLKDTMLGAINDILELSKPLDDCKLRPGLTVEMRE